MSSIISLIKSMAKKKVEEVVQNVQTEEVKSERDADFYAKHTGAQDNVIYG